MPRRRLYSNQQMLDRLAACAQRRGGVSPTQVEFDRDQQEQLELTGETKISAIAIRKRFHGWNEALAEIGLEPIQHGRKAMDPEVVLDALREQVARLGVVPTARDFERDTNISSGVIERAFGSYNDLVKEAGLQDVERASSQRYDDDELVRQLATWISEHGREPSFEEYNEDKSSASAQTIAVRLGSWARGKQLAKQLLARDSDSANETEQRESA